MRDALTRMEISELCSLMRRLFAFQQQLREENPLAKKLKCPQVPPSLSESLAMHLLTDGNIIPELEEAKCSFGGRRADIIAKKGKGELLIEVKATSQSGFQRLRSKDVSAAYIVWIHFGDFFQNNSVHTIAIYIISNPGKYFKEWQEADVRKLPEIVDSDLQTFELDLDEFLQGSRAETQKLNHTVQMKIDCK